MQNETDFLLRVHARAAEIEKQSIRHRIGIIQAVSAAAGIAAVIAIALMMPEALPAAGAGSFSMQASIFADNGSLGYIVVGVLAFMLGIGVTVLCFHLKKYIGKQEESHDRDR